MATKGESATTEIKKEVKVVKKQVKKEKKIEESTKKAEKQNGEQNGDDTNAELTVKIPTKKIGAKIETKVEVERKILPDGTVEEKKITTTRTTKDGKTEIATKTETRTLPKEEADAVVEIEEEEEEEEVVEEENGKVVTKQEEKTKEIIVEEPKKTETKKTVVKEASTPKENGHKEAVIKKEERRSETITTKKVTVQKVEEPEEEEEVEEEEEEEVEEEERGEETAPVVQKEENKVVHKSILKKESKPVEEEEVEEEEEEEEEEQQEEQKVVLKKVETEVKKVEVKKDEPEEEEEEEEEVVSEEEAKEEQKEVKDQESTQNKEEEVEEEEEEEEVQEEEIKTEIKEEKKPEPAVKEQKKEEEEESEYTEEEYESEHEDTDKKTPEVKEAPKEPELKQESKPEPKVEPKEEKTEIPRTPPTTTVPLREPSIPLDKVEDVEIKPIGETFTRTQTENTEIIRSSNEPSSLLSTQTDFNRYENIVTVNRTTKTLDRSYEELTQHGIPIVKTYFAPNREKVSPTPQPARPFQSTYTEPPTTERRHSLLLDRLSIERQAPVTDTFQNNYQYSNQSYEQQNQWSQEPQSEVVNVSNVKPSSIGKSNQQWYQQQESRKENLIYNNVPSTPASQWNQPQPQFQPQTPQPQYQPPTQQPQYQPPTQQPQYQQSYTEKSTQDYSQTTSNVYQQDSYQNYTQKPSTWGSNNLGNLDTLPSLSTPSNQYSFLNKDSSHTYQNTSQTQSSTYVPPPWEQDSSYVVDNSNQNYYQPSTGNTFSPGSSLPSQPTWKPAPPLNKFSKPTPTAYIPPAPNQSFVIPVSNVEPPKIPGRKTYYSEYERRYISVPESTYVPPETKLQPDPSPQYYYDNNEPSEPVEHQWRKELREFTEKSSQSQYQTEQSSVRPPWEDDPKYVKVPAPAYTPTPTWSQTVRPRSWREKSFESEQVGSQDWQKTNTLGRSRPMSSYVQTQTDPPVTERPRGVSVDRYNPNNYQTPISAEHPPVQTHILNPAVAKSYHNPTVPAYHSRASAEPRDRPVTYHQPRKLGADPRENPVQSRSFKYLQWITGTEE